MPELHWQGARTCATWKHTVEKSWGPVSAGARICEDQRGPVSGAASCSCLLSFTDKPVCTPSISLYRNTDILGIYVQYFSCYIKLYFFWTSDVKATIFEYLYYVWVGSWPAYRSGDVIVPGPEFWILKYFSQFSSIFTNINFRPVILNWLILVKLGQQHLHPLHPVWLSGWPSILNSTETIRLSWTRVTIKHKFWR